MNIKKLSVAAAVSALTFATASNAVLGPIPIYLNPIKISANYFDGLDTNATFSTELYSSKDIKESGSTNLYDFLSNNTSITITPSAGNRFSQKIDMRGYGTTNGHKNVVITVDGTRLNNHTSSPQSVGNIILDNIDRIEITKGSGSVVYGDGAMSGVIHIFMKDTYDSFAKLETGNYGLTNKSISTSSKSDKLNVNAAFETQEKGGYAIADSTGNKDWGKKTNKTINLKIDATNNAKIELSLANNDSDYRYPEYQTITQFNSDPAQNGTGRNYAHSIINSDEYSLGLTTKINESLSLDVKTTEEEKTSETTFYWGSGGIKKDKKTSDSLSLKYTNNNTTIDGGFSKLYGERNEKSYGSSTFDKLTTKDNKGYFIQAKHSLDDTSYVAGYRNESVDYFYNKTSATGSHDLTAYNIGINKNLDDNLSIFSNYNKAFQAYDTNTAFKYTGAPTYDNTFDGFLKPMTSKTLNIGLNYINQASKTKLTLFHSNLNNEIYLHKQNSSDFGTNSNLDKSHKTGIEIDSKYVVNLKTTIGINYSYVDAIIDSEDNTEDRGSFNGKTLPGVSKNTLAANIKFKLDDKSTLALKHKYRSEAFGEEDFSNTNTDKTKAFNSTDLNYAYNHSKDVEFSLDIENLFKKKHATLLGDYNSTGGNVVYPASFTRNIKAGLTYKF
ncbi:MAG: TonB-dependent receptor [Proteobacteria bacterium]|nr:TonB-dependent receptor [Pseudomonadota bacterium]MCH9749648.1 TonB-dependent receptor [Pseudomonadota bacterium]